MAGRNKPVINDHAAKAGQPGEGALRNPALGQRHEAAWHWQQQLDTLKGLVALNFNARESLGTPRAPY
ncbi:hypothetical protein [Hymenobacter seoulensis]